MVSIFQNWGGTIRWQPKETLYPRSVDELQQVIRKNDSVLVVGSRHSFSRVLEGHDKTTAVVDLCWLCGVKFYGTKNGRRLYEIQGGTILRDVAKTLKADGCYFINTGSVLEQTIAGALSTCTHGSGSKFQSMCGQVHSIDVVDGYGELHTGISEESNPTLFLSTLGGIGTIGIIVAVRLYVDEDKPLCYSSEKIEGNIFAERFITVAETCLHTEAYWFPYQNRAYLITRDNTTAPVDKRGVGPYIQNFVAGFFGDWIYPVLVSLIRAHAPLSRSLSIMYTNLIFAFLPKEKHVGFKSEILSEEISRKPWKNMEETEFNIRADDLNLLLTRLADILNRYLNSYELFLEFPVHIRIVHSDKFFASPFQNSDSTVFLSFSMPNIANETNAAWKTLADNGECVWSSILGVFDEVCGRANVRFHLGKSVPDSALNETIMDRMPGIFTWKKVHGYYNKRGVLTNSLSSDLLKLVQ